MRPAATNSPTTENGAKIIDPFPMLAWFSARKGGGACVSLSSFRAPKKGSFLESRRLWPPRISGKGQKNSRRPCEADTAVFEKRNIAAASMLPIHMCGTARFADSFLLF